MSDPNANRNSMGSRAGTSLKNKLGGGAVGAPSRLGTVGKVIIILNLGKFESFRRSWKYSVS